MLERRLFDLRSGVCRRFPSEIRECSIPKCSSRRALTHGVKISARFDDQGVKSPKIRFRPWFAHLEKIFVLCWYFWTRSQCAKFEAKRVKISGVTGGVEKRYRHFFMTSISGPYVGFYSTDFENSLTGRLLRVASHRVPTGIREGHLKRQSREGTSLNGSFCSQNAKP